MLALQIRPKSANRSGREHRMKETIETARPAGHASGVRLTAQDMARIRTVAAALRSASNRKALVLGGRNAADAASALAGELQLDLFRVDLSAVVSKFIGETEKNLARLFTAAGERAVVVLFDEADALFGRRTGVSDAHDRYSNAEINSLLRGLERHHGLAVFISKAGTTLPMKLRRWFSLYRFPPADLR
jgi:hypothetical protein